MNLTPAQWRALTRLYPHTGGVGSTYRVPAHRMLSEQEATRDDLIVLQQRGFISARLGDLDVEMSNVRPGAPLRTIRLACTGAGGRYVHGSEQARIIGYLVSVSGRASVQSIRYRADADDGDLRDLEAAGIVQALGSSGTQTVPMMMFRSLPGELLVRLTKHGRRFYAYPGAGWVPGSAAGVEADRGWR